MKGKGSEDHHKTNLMRGRKGRTEVLPSARKNFLLRRLLCSKGEGKNGTYFKLKKFKLRHNFLKVNPIPLCPSP